MRRTIANRTTSHNRRRFRRLGRGALVVIAGLAGLLTVTALSDEPRPTWAADRGAPVPPDFLYAMFPVGNAVPKFEAPNGASHGTLGRALVNSQEELSAGDHIRVIENTGMAWVRRADLDFLPAPDASTEYFAAFEAAYRARDPKALRSADLTMKTNAGETTAKLRLCPDDDHVEVYVYRVADGKATALEMTRYFGPGESLKVVVPAFFAGIVAAAVAAVLTLLIRRRSVA